MFPYTRADSSPAFVRFHRHKQRIGCKTLSFPDRARGLVILIIRIRGLVNDGGRRVSRYIRRTGRADHRIVKTVLELSEAKFQVWLAPALPCWLAVGEGIHGERVIDNRVVGRCDQGRLRLRNQCAGIQGNKAVKLLHGGLVGRATKITKPGCPPNVLFRVCSGFSKIVAMRNQASRRQSNP